MPRHICRQINIALSRSTLGAAVTTSHVLTCFGLGKDHMLRCRTM